MAWGSGAIDERTTATGEARYRARWRDGDRVRTKTFTSRDEAEDHLLAVSREKRDGRYVPPSELTVGEAVHAWLARGAQSWSVNTLVTTENRAEKHVVRRLGTLRVQAVTRDRVQHWVDGLVASGLAPGTVEGVLRVLRAALDEVVQAGVIAANPCTGVRRPLAQHTGLATWTLDEVRAVYRVVADDPWLDAWYRVALTCGLRPGEQRALRWDDLDWRRGVLHVRRTMTRGADGKSTVGATTKTKRARAVAVPASTLGALRRLRGSLPVVTLDGPIFPGPRGAEVEAFTVRGRHEQVIRDAGVCRITLHQLRHTSATLDMESGAHPKVVQERLGHRRIETTLNTYAHVSDDLQRASSDKLAARLDAVADNNITAWDDEKAGQEG